MGDSSSHRGGAEEEPGVPELKNALIGGGSALAVRETAGLLLSLIAVPIIFREIGPTGYGLLGVALAIGSYANRIGALGLDLYLIRYPGTIPSALVGETLAFVGLIATLLAGAILVAATPLARLFGIPGAENLVRLAAGYVWLYLLGRIPLASLEHKLKFRTVAGIELTGILVYFGLVLSLIFSGSGYWGVALAMLAQSAVMTTLAFVRNPIVPRLIFPTPGLRRAVSFAFASQASIWLWSLRDLAGPVLVGNLLGLEALGIITGAFLVLNRVAFLRQVVWRSSVAGLAKIDDPGLLRRAIAKGMLFQVILLGAVFAVFAVTSPWVLPPLIGERWDQMIFVFPFIAFGTLVNATFGLHSAALFARSRIGDMTVFHLAHVVTLWAVAALLIPVFGLGGYCAAEIAATWPYVLLHFYLKRELGSPDYRLPLVIAGASAAVLFSTPWVSPVAGFSMSLLLGGGILYFSPRTRHATKEAFNGFASAFARR